MRYLEAIMITVFYVGFALLILYGSIGVSELLWPDSYQPGLSPFHIPD